MARLLATAGTKFFIGTAMAFDGGNVTVSDFDEQSWTRITGTTNIGATGDSAEVITSSQIDPGNPENSARVRKAKGPRNAGTMTIICDVNYEDPGQLALIAAEKSADTYAFKIEFNDAPAGGTPSERYFIALVMSATEEMNEANNIIKLNSELEIDSNIVRVAAAEA